MAVRITLKRSSIFNKRPNADILDPGELALNTNALSPGLFFETENNEVVKVGPTAVGVTPPTPFPSLGETFFDSVTRQLQVGGLDPDTATQVWLNVASPYLGGTDGYVVFVAPEFPTATDAIDNDGQASPFKSLNRAVLEITKRSIVINNESDEGKNNRFVIYVAPGICPVYNGPGTPLPRDVESPNTFNVNFEATLPAKPTVLNLQQFNSETGGLPLPRGTSILGMDLRKVELRPNYVPTYKNPTTLLGDNQPLSAVIKWTGNSYVQNLSVRDKRTVIRINLIKEGAAGEGLFVSSRAHCFNLNDEVFFEFSPGADQRPINGQSAGVLAGRYYVNPVDADTFLLSYIPITDSEANYIERDQLPVSPQGPGYIASCYWEGRSHNRLRAFYPADFKELNQYYEKVQLAFPKYFQGKSNQGEVVNPGETVIVGPVPPSVPESILSNTTDNASPYVDNVTVRSNFGLCGLEQNGDIVSGFRSALAGLFCVASLQTDPAAYEIYTTVQDPERGVNETRWYTLQYATWASLPPESRPSSPALVSRVQQLELLNNTELTNIRFYFETLKAEDGKSFGVPDENADFRHFAIKSSNAAFVQVSEGWSIGCAVGYWSTGGGRMTVTNSSSNFGMNGVRAEGFYRIGSSALFDGTSPADSNFRFEGIRMPDRIIPRDTVNYKTIELGGAIRSVFNNGDVQEITLGPGFQPINILPYALSPETAVYVAAGGNTIYRAFFVNDGDRTVILRDDGSAVFRVRAIDSTFPLGAAETNPSLVNWSSPFIRRWVDPRTIAEASYSLILTNTNPGHRSPIPGAVLRLNQNSPYASTLLRPGVQLDPGPNGGWGRVFQAAFVETTLSGDSPQFNEVLLNRNVADSYYISIALCDGARPWLQERDHAHGIYTTYNERNWYAACNDQWEGVYYGFTQSPVTDLKLPPTNSNSPWATSFSSELQEPVASAYQGVYAADPDIDLYPDGTYFRGDVLALDNYGFDLVVNIDNATPNFGLLRHTVPSTISKTITEELKPGQRTVTVSNVDDIPSPFKDFVVMELVDGDRREYVQVIGVDKMSLTLTLIRGVYGTETTSSWRVDTPITLQVAASEVLTTDYDFDWSISKSSMIRFLQVMGYSKASISKILAPRYRSARNISIGDIADQPQKGAGYAVSTGAWPLEFSMPSQVDALGHSFHSVGRLDYSRGLPVYLRNELPTKQYYDYLSTQIWAGLVSLTGGDELGNLPTDGVFTEAETGRPIGTYTSDIKNSSRIDPGPGEGGGGGGADGVVAVYTGEGLTGGPIFAEGTISLLPPTSTSIGGVKQGANITIDPDGTISSTASGSGTVESITFTNGLTGGTITQSGTVGVNVGEGLKIADDGTLAVTPGSSSKIGGVKAGTAISISTEGTISVLPPSGPVIGGVKQGSGVTIAPDGTISVTDVPTTGIVLLDNLTSSFNGTRTQFPLTVGGQDYTPTSSFAVMITVGNVPQPTPSAYFVSGSQITFTSAPPAGADFYGIGLNGSLAMLPAAGLITAQLDDISSQFNGSQTDFTLKIGGIPFAPKASYYAYIVVGGIVQATPSAYTVTGSTITFTAPPPKDATFYGITFG